MYRFYTYNITSKKEVTLTHIWDLLIQVYTFPVMLCTHTIRIQHNKQNRKCRPLWGYVQPQVMTQINLHYRMRSVYYTREYVNAPFLRQTRVREGTIILKKRTTYLVINVSTHPIYVYITCYLYVNNNPVLTYCGTHIFNTHCTGIHYGIISCMILYKVTLWLHVLKRLTYTPQDVYTTCNAISSKNEYITPRTYIQVFTISALSGEHLSGKCYTTLYYAPTQRNIVVSTYP